MEVPAFLRERLLAQYGAETAARIEAGYAARRCTTLRVNTLKADAVSVRARLTAAGIPCETAAFSGDALILPPESERAVEALALYAAGEVYVQSLSSMLPPLLLGAKPGEDILDMAAAPGGKTTQIAALTAGRAAITACERSKPRAERLRFNIARQGAPRVTVLETDARQLSDLFRFDRVLLDAPCSGSGTLSAGTSERARFSPELLARAAKTQGELLEKAMRLARPGATVVYSTCSVLEEENERVVRRALESGAAELSPVDPADFPGAPLLPTSLPGALLVCPDAQWEGFFAARLVKIKDPAPGKRAEKRTGGKTR